MSEWQCAMVSRHRRATVMDQPLFPFIRYACADHQYLTYAPCHHFHLPLRLMSEWQGMMVRRHDMVTHQSTRYGDG